MATSKSMLSTGYTPESFSRMAASSWLILLLLFLSCEIEDDFGKPDNSSYLGTTIYTSQYDFINKLLWNEQTNQIISIGNDITIIDVDTKKSNQLNIYTSGSSNFSWVAENTLYYLNNNTQLSSVDLTNGFQNQSLVDSIAPYYDGLPFSSRYFAFNKSDKYDPSNEPYLYLYDLETQQEKLITTGSPIAFSPDSQTLLFFRHDPNNYVRPFYSYSFQTKAITALQMQDPPGNIPIIKWTTEGILFYYQNYNGKLTVFNGTNNTILGEWESITWPSYGLISPSGKKMITLKEKCASNSTQSYCASFFKQHYYVVDVINDKEIEAVYGPNLNAMQFAFSPDENSVALLMGNSIHLVKLKE